MAGPMHFDARADDYAVARPPYPSALWERVQAIGLLQKGARALDLGAGTGEASGPLAAAGLRVTAVEPGVRLATRLRTAHPSVRVLLARAEDVRLPDDSFELAVAATSIHWMDPAVVLPKVHAALTDEGRFLVMRNVFGDADAPPTPFRARVAEIVAARGGPRRADDAENLVAVGDRLTASGLFRLVETATFRWDIELTAEQLGRLFSTFSDWTVEEVTAAVDAVHALGGAVTEHYSSWLLVMAPVPAGHATAGPI